MKFALIVCTYMRPQPLMRLLHSVRSQTLLPSQVIIVDGSLNDDSLNELKTFSLNGLEYFKVGNEDRGLTKQRNFGIDRVSEDIDVVAFLDDDVVLDNQYFKQLASTYQEYPNALGVGGYITNEVAWQLQNENSNGPHFYNFDGYVRKESSRYKLRKKLGLDHHTQPGTYPPFGHGRSIGFLPPSGKTYKVDLFMGGVASYPKQIVDAHKFSTFFEGYGLYEDAEYTLRLSNEGSLYVNTLATCQHFHAPDGRPNHYKYGKMVVRNGWFVWRTKYPNPSFKNKLKWHSITLILILIRILNIFTTSNRKEAFTESLGRIVSWVNLFFSRPK